MCGIKTRWPLLCLILAKLPSSIWVQVRLQVSETWFIFAFVQCQAKHGKKIWRFGENISPVFHYIHSLIYFWEKNASLIIVDRDFLIHLSYDWLESSIYQTFVEKHETVQAFNKSPLQGKMQHEKNVLDKNQPQIFNVERLSSFFLLRNVGSTVKQRDWTTLSSKI